MQFELKSIDLIRNDDAYGGYRVGIVSKYDGIVTPMQIDITTGDVITPKEVKYTYEMAFTNGSIGIWAYNIETVLAEKVETILQRGELNTRPRDFYDVYILTKTQVYDQAVFLSALTTTAEHRKTSHIFNETTKILMEIAESGTLSTRWRKYTTDYKYADGITYENVIEALRKLLCV